MDTDKRMMSMNMKSGSMMCMNTKLQVITWRIPGTTKPKLVTNTIPTTACGRNEVYDDGVYDDEVDDGVHEDEVAAAEDARQTQQMQRKLNWLLLNGSWHSFLEWLGERWWGLASEEQNSSSMETPKVRAGERTCQLTVVADGTPVEIDKPTNHAVVSG